MDKSQHTFSGLDELSQIRSEVRSTTSLSELRANFDRVKALRRTYSDDLDALVRVSELQDEIVERARSLNGKPGDVSWKAVSPAKPASEDVAEIPPEVERLDAKNWQRAVYIGLFFAVILFAAFFYLVQTARRLNIMPVEQSGAQNQQQTSAPKSPASQPVAGASPAPSTMPTVRLYTDLIPGTVTVDDKPPQDLRDGEFVLDSLEAGRHSIQVTGPGGNAAFSYEVVTGQAPRLIGSPAASNVMAVLVSTESGKAHLVTSAEHSDVSLDGNAAGQAGADGLNLNDLGKTDHLLQITEGKDRQRFVLTYSPTPTLTAYVKADFNGGTVVIITKEDGADVFINDKPYRRKTDAGQLRIPLRVGDYTIRVHKAGFIDPPPETVGVKKAEETAVNFRMEAVPQIATLEVKGALGGTMIFLDKTFAAAIGADGNATISNVKPGDHLVELRRDQALPKRFERSFKTGDVVQISGTDATLEKVVVENNTPAPQPVPPAATTPDTAQNAGMEVEGQQLRKGGGFVPYHTPKVAGRYSFAGQALKGGFLKRGKLQWYAGYRDSQNYILFTVDGKHAMIHEIRDGVSNELGRVPFDSDASTWVQVDLAVKPGSLDAHIKTPDTGWQPLGHVTSPGRDFTQDKVGFYIPDKDEVAIANFRFSAH